jgi:hypothetical protein
MKTAYARDVLTLAHSTETSASTCKDPMVQQSMGLGPAKLEASLVQQWSRFMLQKRDGRTRVYKRRNERFTGNCVLEVDNSGGGSVMIWGAISYARKPQLVHIPGHLKAARYMLPSMNLCREGFQHDNARPHTARSTVDFLTNQNVTVLPWPSKSPDMNPIKQLWYDFERRMCSRQPVLQTLQTYSRLLSKNGKNSARPYSSIARVYIETGRYCVTG